jgi:hypothetical protein
MEDCERRHARRFVVQVPLAFRPIKPPGFPKCFGEIVNISTEGVCFSTQTCLSTGAIVQVFLKLPREIMGSAEHCWTGKVVYFRSLGKGVVEMGVHFLACDDAGLERRKAMAGQPSA